MITRVRTVLFPLAFIVLLSCCESPDATKSIEGTWTRSGGTSPSTYTEVFALKADHTYTIEATRDTDSSLIAADHGSYSYTETELTTTDFEGNVAHEPYVLEDGGDRLILNHQSDHAWIRIAE